MALATDSIEMMAAIGAWPNELLAADDNTTGGLFIQFNALGQALLTYRQQRQQIIQNHDLSVTGQVAAIGKLRDGTVSRLKTTYTFESAQAELRRRGGTVSVRELPAADAVGAMIDAKLLDLIAAWGDLHAYQKLLDDVDGGGDGAGILAVLRAPSLIQRQLFSPKQLNELSDKYFRTFKPSMLSAFDRLAEALKITTNARDVVAAIIGSDVGADTRPVPNVVPAAPDRAPPLRRGASTDKFNNAA